MQPWHRVSNILTSRTGTLPGGSALSRPTNVESTLQQPAKKRKKKGGQPLVTTDILSQ